MRKIRSFSSIGARHLIKNEIANNPDLMAVTLETIDKFDDEYISKRVENEHMLRTKTDTIRSNTFQFFKQSNKYKSQKNYIEIFSEALKEDIALLIRLSKIIQNLESKKGISMIKRLFRKNSKELIEPHSHLLKIKPKTKKRNKHRTYRT